MGCVSFDWTSSPWPHFVLPCNHFLWKRGIIPIGEGPHERLLLSGSRPALVQVLRKSIPQRVKLTGHTAQIRGSKKAQSRVNLVNTS